MPFDAEASVRAAHLFCDIKPAQAVPIATPGDPDLAWAAANPDRLLAFLYVSPRPCAALDALIGQ